jgi:aryl-alcohol dehydrogenase-like predicted oxidoreductase
MYLLVGSGDIVRDVVAISHENRLLTGAGGFSWVRQQPGPVIPLIAARTEEQFRDNLAAIDMHLSQAKSEERT